MLPQGLKERLKKRSYQSEIRQRQADETRARMVVAARKLLEEHGYAGMTMGAVAKKAGVAVATVYAVFGSKTGILSAILDAARFDESYQGLVREAMQASDPRERMRFPARIARRIYESEHSVLDLLRGAGAVAPALAESESKRECTRYEAQAGMIQFLVRSRSLRRGLDAQRARDILWSLTSRDLYRLLVQERGWTAQQYEDWLANTLVEAVVRPDVARDV
jgi:TetR/AcrR family transcriptional regulator, regulator of cefoperazone and chloramphenicol sensitivity